MVKEVVIVSEDGIVIVKRRSKRSKKIAGSRVIIPYGIIQQMEIRVESVFRPNAEDVETTYALTGNNVMEMLHTFTSKEVIRSAIPFEIHTKVEAKVKQILEERAEVGKASTVIDIHTHPQGSPVPSDQDLIVFKRAYAVYSRHFEKVFFGIHAVSEELKLRRKKPEVKFNVVSWCSLNRKHEVAFYDSGGNPVEVEVWMR